jgi:hypothetical protein
MSDEVRQRQAYNIVTKATIFSGAPYEKEHIDGIMSIFDELAVSANPFRYELPEEENIEDSELIELWEKIR